MLAQIVQSNAVGGPPIVRFGPKARSHFEVGSARPGTFSGPAMKNPRGDYENRISKFQLASIVNGEKVPQPRVVLDSVFGKCEADLHIVLLVTRANLHGHKRYLDLNADS